MNKEEKILINQIRTGQRPAGRILKNDPLALEKLKAKRDCLVEEREFKKVANRNARLQKQKLPYKTSVIADLTSKICKLNDRIIEIEKNSVR
ncbi:hypothetical protein [Peptostreptococcus porci]|uniref:hypothetical protein n=1 Tax=Peptostreptococcus porci TaxID=2652282 RepID=UPI0023F46001|nr:hypothetical protein [Peptostreptococcus porci]MDD7182348.1 hypothetical protein [Peptostreptococcus porci]